MTKQNRRIAQGRREKGIRSSQRPMQTVGPLACRLPARSPRSAAAEPRLPSNLLAARYVHFRAVSFEAPSLDECSESYVALGCLYCSEFRNSGKELRGGLFPELT